MKPRVLVLPIAAVVIVGLVVWKKNQPRRSRENIPMPVYRQPVSDRMFQLLDVENKPVKLERYVGRHQMLLIFFRGDFVADTFARGPDGEFLLSESDQKSELEPLLRDLLVVRERSAEIEAADAKVVAVSSALPQHMKRAEELLGKFPFDVLSDPTLEISKQWNRLDWITDVPLRGIFTIDRLGTSPFVGDDPKSEDSIDAAIQRLQESRT